MLKDLPRVHERFWRALKIHYLKQSPPSPYHSPTGECTQVKCWERTWKMPWQKAECYKKQAYSLGKTFSKLPKMEYFSQNLKNEKDLVCALCRAGKKAKRKSKYQTPAAEWDHWAGRRARRCGGDAPFRGAPPPCRSVAQRSAEGIRKPRIVVLVILSSDMACEIPKFIIYLHLTIIMGKSLLQIYF